MKTEKLPKVFKRKWIKALLSGEFEQGQAYLKRHGAYCCLGVACEVAGAKVRVSSAPGFIFDGRAVRGIKKIPTQLIGKNSLTIKLASFNDGGKSFKYIAGWINENL